MAEADLKRILDKIAEERKTDAMKTSATILAKMAAAGELRFLDRIEDDKIKRKR